MEEQCPRLTGCVCSDLAGDYCKRTREGGSHGANGLGGISESLGLEEETLLKSVNWDSGFQMFTANLYPPCPQRMFTANSDHGLLTLLAQNEINGLQIQHNRDWVPVKALPSSFLVNTGSDHLEIISHGKYKSNIHRAMVNGRVTRMSLVVANEPSLDTVVVPAPDLVHDEDSSALYKPMNYRDYLELQQGNQLDGKSCLDRVRIA